MAARKTTEAGNDDEKDTIEKLRHEDYYIGRRRETGDMQKSDWQQSDFQTYTLEGNKLLMMNKLMDR